MTKIYGKRKDVIPMNKLIKKFKESNKGFTLVELIVVIAVLAVITVVVAPQYLQYVEKARIGTDENAIGEIAHIAEIEYVGLEATEAAGATIDNNVVVTVDPTSKEFVIAGTDKLDEAVEKIMGNYTVKSKKYAGATITITVDTTKGVVASYTATGLDE